MDVANPGSASDEEQKRLAALEDRVLITRDRRLAEECKKSGIGCILIRSNSLREQLEEMARFGVDLSLKPCRCTICNGHLEESAEEPASTCQPQEPEKRWRCQGCGKLYWQGSHWMRIEETMRKINEQSS